MREKDIEQHLVKRCKDLGVLCFKFTSPSCTGVPDRILVFPNGLVTFLELKAPGKTLRPKQAVIHAKLAANLAQVAVMDSKEGVDVLLAFWERYDKQK